MPQTKPTEWTISSVKRGTSQIGDLWTINFGLDIMGGRLRQLKRRGLQTARLFVGDGHLGLWAAVGDVFLEAKEQLCWNHKSLNVLDALHKREQVAFKPHQTAMMYAESRSKACEAHKQFDKLSATSRSDQEDRGPLGPTHQLLLFPSSGALEAPADVECGGVAFSRVRLRTGAAPRFKSAAKVTWLIWKTLMVAEKNFRKLNAPHLVEHVAEGRIYSNGVEGNKRDVA